MVRHHYHWLSAVTCEKASLWPSPRIQMLKTYLVVSRQSFVATEGAPNIKARLRVRVGGCNVHTPTLVRAVVVFVNT
jgi:hypothetical protein